MKLTHRIALFKEIKNAQFRIKDIEFHVIFLSTKIKSAIAKNSKEIYILRSTYLPFSVQKL